MKAKTVKFFVALYIVIGSIFFQNYVHSQDNIESQKLQAIQIVQNLVKTENLPKAELLVGGYSGSVLIKLITSDKAYVVRFIEPGFYKNLDTMRCCVSRLHQIRDMVHMFILLMLRKG